MVKALRCTVSDFSLAAIIVAASTFLSLTPVFSADEAAGEWTRFRGPNGTGISDAKTIPVEFTVADYEWRAELPGEGHSSPVVMGKQVYVTSTKKGTDGKRTILCYNADDGRKLWGVDVAFDEHNLNKANNFASSTPTCDANGVYVTWASGQKAQAMGVNHEGEVMWERSWDGFTSDHGAASSPIIVEGLLVFHTDSKDDGRSQIRALDPATGSDVWTHERVTTEGEKHLTVYSTPLVLENGGRKVVALLSPNDGWLGLDAVSGEVVWRHKDDYKYRSVGSPVAGGEMLFGTMGSGGAGKDSAALRFASAGGKTVQPELAYSLGIKDGLSYVPSPLLFDDLLFLWGDGGIVACREANSGTEVYKERVGGNFFSSPIIVDGKIYCGSKEGEMVVIPASHEFEVLGRSKFDSGIYATPAVANGRMFVRTETHLIAVGGGK